MRYAKKNHRVVDDSAVESGLSETQEARFEVVIFGPHVEGDGETVADFWAGSE